MMLSAVALSLSLFTAIMTPAECALACAGHAASIGQQAANQTRYLHSSAADEDGRKRDWVAVTYLLNMASQNRILYRPAVMAGGEIIVVDLAAISDPNDPKSYERIFETWERLASDDFYSHVKTQIAVVEVDKKAKAGEKAEPKAVTVPGGWCAEELAKLNEATGSQGAMLRVDYFISRAGAEEYNALAGVNATLDQELAAFGVDENVVAKLQGQVAANIARSNVRTGRAPRRIVALPGVHGPVIFTLDNAKDNAAGNPFAFPASVNEVQRFRADAYEVFSLGGNGFWKTSVFDGNRKIVAEVPNNIAQDKFGDKIIRNGVGCVRCHSSDGGTAGVQAFADQQAKLNRKGIKSYDPQVLAAILATYDEGRMAKLLKRSQEDHHDAVVSACGTKTPDEAVLMLSEVFSQYRDADVTLSVAAHEVCLTPVEFAEVMQGALDPGGIINLILDGDPVSRGQWEPTYAECALLAEKHRKGDK